MKNKNPITALADVKELNSSIGVNGEDYIEYIQGGQK